MKLITEESDQVEVIVEEINGKKSLYIEGIFLQGDMCNRNKRLYEMDTLREGVKAYTERYLSKSRAVGELGHPCLSGDARLLTANDGWKHIQDSKEGELVYTLNPTTTEAELHPIKKVVVNFHKGVLYNLKNRGINTKVTPDHRFLIYNSRNHNEYKFVTAQEVFEDLNGQNKLSKWYIPKYSLGLNTNYPDVYTIPKSNTITSITNKTLKYLSDLELEFSSFVAFLGIYLSEGSCSKRSNGSYCVSISQNEGHKADAIREVLHSLNGLEWNESKYENKVVWSCYDRRLGEYLHPIGDCYHKYVPKDVIQNLNSEAARIFIDYFALGDGRGSIDEKYSRCDVFSTSKKLIDDISHIAIIAGLGISRFDELCEKDYTFADRTINAENKSRLYFCRFLSTKGIYLDARFLKISEEVWDDNVYCIQVENTNFIVEQGGYTYWTGNCGPAINLDRVSHNIISLKESGTNFMGKAKILTSLPMGKIAAGLYQEGVKLGVSSRGVGSLVPTSKGYSVVGRDFMLSTAADIVHDPSAPDAFVQGVMEGIEWIYDASRDSWLMENTKKRINKLVDQRLLEDYKVNLFNEFLKSI